VPVVRLLPLLVSGTVAAVSFAGTAPAQAATTSTTTTSTTTTPAVPGLPASVPAAALRAEPTLPTPAGWPFADAFSRTSGTGRLSGGASYWSDWVYDDRGASSPVAIPTNVQSDSYGDALAPAQGGYTYSSAAAHNNGADIFRTAVGLTSTTSYWRIDWNTLADPTVPIAEWTFDTDGNAATGASAWPAGAGVSSPGIEKALVVSSRGTELLDAATGAVLAQLPTTVDTSARSFVVAVPRSVLPVSGAWKVRLGAGVADATGTSFAAPQEPAGQSTAARLYNVTFRRAAQEPPVYTDGTTDALEAALQKQAATTPLLQQLGADGQARLVTGNFWGEDHQADALAAGNVSPFALTVDWSALAARRATPEPLVTGYSNRWYVTDLDLGQGIVPNSGNPSGDVRPNYLGRVQPYAVYVPTGYTGGQATPLTWIEHSLSVNYNQYGALDPQQLQQECEQRGSICATTEGFGPDGWYQDEAQHDFFQVWRQLALGFRLDTEHTVMTGYSMGGYASYLLGLTYPDLFAEAMPLAGPPSCGLYVIGPVGGSGDGGTGSDPHCDNDGKTGPLVANATWVPYVMADGVLDELVPYSSVLEQISHFDTAGLRYHFLTYPTEDHLAFAAQDRFSAPISLLGTPARVTDPGTIHYSWYPDAVSPGLGIGASSVYWLSGLGARTTTGGTVATVTASDGARPMPAHTTAVTTTPVPGALSYVDRKSSWVLGPTPPATRTLQLGLTDVSTLTVDTARALLPQGTARVTSDGPATLTLSGLRPGTAVRVWGGQTTVAGHDGTAAVALPAGTSTVSW
jgi:hypothetical protein